MQTLSRKTTRRGAPRSSCARTLFCDAPSYLGAAEGICMLVRHFLMQISMPYLVFSTELIVRECLNNAITHGNGSDPDKRVKVSITATQSTIRVRVTDQGNGFAWKRLATLRAPAPASCDGRGLAIIGTYADRVAFNRKGNVITIDINSKRNAKGESWPPAIA